MSLVSPLDGWLRDHLYAVVFLGTVVDALGIPFPGRIMLMTVGSVSAPSRHAGIVIALAVIGTLLGDHVWYLVGRSRSRRLLALYRRILRLPGSRAATAERLIGRFGGLALVLGRFAATLRIVVTPLAVSRGITYGRFLVFDGLGAVVWVGGCVWLGRAAGALGAATRTGGTAAVLALLVVASVAVSVVTHRWLSKRARVSRACGNAP